MLRGLIVLSGLSLLSLAWAVPQVTPEVRTPRESVQPSRAALYGAVVGRREIVTALHPIPETQKGTARYLGTTRFLVAAPAERIRKHLTNYAALKGMSEYIHTVDYRPKQKILVVKGKVIGYEFGAALKVEPKSPLWTRYTPQTIPQVDDHTDIFLEPLGQSKHQSTAVHFESEITLTTRWIPDAVVRKAYRLVVESLALRFRDALEKSPGRQK